MAFGQCPYRVDDEDDDDWQFTGYQRHGLTSLRGSGGPVWITILEGDS